MLVVIQVRLRVRTVPIQKWRSWLFILLFVVPVPVDECVEKDTERDRER